MPFGTGSDRAAWRSEKAVHLFQFLVTCRREPLPREAIVERLWPEAAPGVEDRDFRVALNAVYRALEPNRKPGATAASACPGDHDDRLGT